MHASTTASEALLWPAYVRGLHPHVPKVRSGGALWARSSTKEPQKPLQLGRERLLLEVHKLMYFLQEAGEPLKLQYCEAHYGPYAENLRHVLNAIEGHMVSGYADGGDAPDKQLELIPKALRDAQHFLEDKETTRSHLEKVSDLVDGFESPFGLELLSTVHWVVTRKQPQSADALVSQVHSWNERKRQFSPRQILLARHILSHKGWCTPLMSHA